jgi:hypothetical protein
MRKQSDTLAALRGAPAYEYLYFLRHLDPIDIPYADLNRVLQFAADNNFQRFNVMTEQQSASVIDILRALRPTHAALSRPIHPSESAPSKITRRV